MCFRGDLLVDSICEITELAMAGGEVSRFELQVRSRLKSGQDGQSILYQESRLLRRNSSLSLAPLDRAVKL